MFSHMFRADMNSAEREKLNRDGPSLQKMIGKLSRQKIPVIFVALVLIFIFSKVGGGSGPKTYGIMDCCKCFKTLLFFDKMIIFCIFHV